MRRGQLSFALGVGAMAIAIVASPAQAAATRTEYVAQVDPICQAGRAQEAVARQSFLTAAKRVRRHHPDSRKTSRKLMGLFRVYFAQRAAIEHGVNAQIAAVPPITEDVSLVQVWLRAREELVDVETRFLTTSPPGNIKGAARVIGDAFELIARQFEVNDLVRDFGFQYCSSTVETQFIGAATFK